MGTKLGRAWLRWTEGAGGQRRWLGGSMAGDVSDARVRLDVQHQLPWRCNSATPGDTDSERGDTAAAKFTERAERTAVLAAGMYRQDEHRRRTGS